jgi:hypothetical protein
MSKPTMPLPPEEATSLERDLDPSAAPTDEPSLLHPGTLGGPGDTPFSMSDLESLVSAPGVVPLPPEDPFYEDD